MKSVKSSLILIIIVFTLCVSAFSYGVYALYSLTHNSSGSISFESLNADIDLDIIVTGAKINPPKFSGTSNLAREPKKTLITSSTWNFGNLSFDDINAITPEELEIKFEITIFNYSRFPIAANIIVPVISGLTITKQDLDFSYKYNDTIGADERTLIVSIAPINEQVTSANLNLTLNIEKTLKKETDISKFRWSAPINGNISIIGNYLNSNDKEIIIPQKNGVNKVTSVASYAFYNSKNIISLSLPNSVTNLDTYAFYNNKNIISLNLPNSIINIGMAAFANSSAITNLILPKSINFIAQNTFSNCTALTYISIPASVTEIDYGAFSNCSALVKIFLPASVTKIDDTAFSNCISLKSINVDSRNTNFSSENGVLLNKSKTTLLKCPDSKTTYSIPASVNSINSSAFSIYSALTAINVDAGNETFSSENGALFNKSKTELIKCPKGINSFTISKSVTSIDYLAFSGCSTLSSINVDSDNLNYSSDSGLLLNKNKTTLIRCPEGKISCIIPSSVTNIDNFSFYNCGELISITIPSRVNLIDNSLFKNCSSLTAINVDPANETYSSEGGFLLNKNKTTLMQCPGGKTSCILPSSVTSIGASAFSNCNLLTSVTISNNVTNIGNEAFRNCLKLTNVTIPASVTSIGERAFFGCNALNSVTISTGVSTIGKSAFSYCNSLKSVSIPDSVTSIGDSAFADCTELTDFTIPSSVTTLGSYIFSNCYALKNINISNGISVISSSVFSNCKALISVDIPATVTSINSSAFSGCNSLTAINVATENAIYSSDNGALLDKDKNTLIQCPEGKTSYTVPEGVKCINGSAFIDCKLLEYVTIPNSVNTIKDSAFLSCEALTDLTLPASVTSIQTNVFSGCSSLTAINVAPENAIYSSDNGVLLDKNKNTLIQCPEGKTSYIIPAGVTSIGNGAFSNCSVLKSVTIPSSVTSIGNGAFLLCEALTNITIPSSVVNIGGSAFNSCISLASINIPASVASIGASAFSNCELLERVYIERTIAFTSLGKTCFSGIKSGSTLFFKNETVMNQFVAGTHFRSADTVKSLY